MKSESLTHTNEDEHDTETNACNLDEYHILRAEQTKQTAIHIRR
jgi:hypothetical protein